MLDSIKPTLPFVIELADQDLLDVARSRTAEQQVLHLLDEPTSR